MKLQVTARHALTPAIEEFTLSPVDSEILPTAEPGSHITITTPSGARRRYSLVHPGENMTAYTIAIKLDSNSRGGSESMHEQATIGTILEVGIPENDFLLKKHHSTLLIAGGIGITPIYSMAQQLKAEGKNFRVVYCAREPNQTAYADKLKTLCGDSLTLHYSHNNPPQAFDFWELLMTPTAEHIYCCGPAPLMEEVKGVTGHWPEGCVHFEEFKPVEVIRTNDVAFTIELSQTGKTIEIPANRTILETLRETGHVVASSCESGTCGTCKCRYIEGEVDHRDLALSDEEKGSHIMLCVSRAKGDHLVLDI